MRWRHRTGGVGSGQCPQHQTTRAHRYTVSVAIGNQRWKQQPSPTLDSSPIRPSKLCTDSFTILSPTPLPWTGPCRRRSEEHTSELQSRGQLVCRLLLEKKNKKNTLN